MTYASEGRESEDETLESEIQDAPQQSDAPPTHGELEAALEEVGQQSIPMSKKGQQAFGGAPVRPMASPSSMP